MRDSAMDEVTLEYTHSVGDWLMAIAHPDDRQEAAMGNPRITLLLIMHFLSF